MEGGCGSEVGVECMGVHGGGEVCRCVEGWRGEVGRCGGGAEVYIASSTQGLNSTSCNYLPRFLLGKKIQVAPLTAPLFASMS